jgi:hypothetical protein
MDGRTEDFSQSAPRIRFWMTEIRYLKCQGHEYAIFSKHGAKGVEVIIAKRLLRTNIERIVQ